MKILKLENALLATVLLASSTAVLSALPPNTDLLSSTFDARTQAMAAGRGLAESRRVSTEYLVRDHKGRMVKVDSAARLIVKGTMAGASADSYQGAQYLTQRDSQVSIRTLH